MLDKFLAPGLLFMLFLGVCIGWVELRWDGTSVASAALALPMSSQQHQRVYNFEVSEHYYVVGRNAACAHNDSSKNTEPDTPTWIPLSEWAPLEKRILDAAALSQWPQRVILIKERHLNEIQVWYDQEEIQSRLANLVPFLSSQPFEDFEGAPDPYEQAVEARRKS